MKFKIWDGTDLKGEWLISIKIDGVRCHKINGRFMSRKNKPLYNIPDIDFEIAEIFCDSFKETIENTRTFRSEKTIKPEHVFILEPKLDERLIIGKFTDPTKEKISDLFTGATAWGHEGLILQNGDIRLKVKGKETFDVKILRIFEGKGKHIGRLGGFVTDKGKVGTGFTDEERTAYFTDNLIGETVEVSCMHLTEEGKFRHPVFVRLREDK
jgi:ATP-dependent DNA ligase